VPYRGDLRAADSRSAAMSRVWHGTRFKAMSGRFQPSWADWAMPVGPEYRSGVCRRGRLRA
jgi:hypothetical protein